MSRFKAKRRRSIGRNQQKHSDEPAEKQQRHLITVGMPGSGLSSYVMPISPADAVHMAPYLKAHKLLPFFFRYDPAKRRSQRYLERSIRVLADPEATAGDLTRAIVILGHCPDQRAVSALQAYGDAELELSGMARMALQECLSWMGENEGGMLPVAGVN